MNNILAVCLVALTSILLSCTNDGAATAQVREKAVTLMARQQPEVTIKITDWNELRIRPCTGLPENCSNCIIDLSDSTLTVKSDQNVLRFFCPSTGLNTPTAIAYSCSPALPSGQTSSGGGEATLLWDTAFSFICVNAASADSAKVFLVGLIGKKRIGK